VNLSSRAGFGSWRTKVAARKSSGSCGRPGFVGDDAPAADRQARSAWALWTRGRGTARSRGAWSARQTWELELGPRLRVDGGGRKETELTGGAHPSVRGGGRACLEVRERGGGGGGGGAGVGLTGSHAQMGCRPGRERRADRKERKRIPTHNRNEGDFNPV
jgi:hypothetical protein